jgi:NAD(P)-dependent dehydrogenase (short-subunit alcohol dehydrogenase family)
MKRVVIITGGNEGIGFHMSQGLVESGYYVAILDISNSNIAPIVEVNRERMMFINCDVTKPIVVKQSIDSIAKEWEQIDVLVNNACIAVFKSFEQRRIEETRNEFEVNYFGYLNTISAVLPYMKAKGNGIIHNMSSGVGITGFPGIYGYASTKGAIEAMTRTLHLEFSKYGITVNIMHPPLTNTKSASPLGIPAQAMGDPSRVGRNLAKKILSKNSIIPADFQTSLYLFIAYRYPLMLGKLFATLAEGSANKPT